MRISGVTTIDLREPADQAEREGRLAELDQEIRGLRGRISRSLDDEKLLRRTLPQNPQRETELFQLQTERERDEIALANLTKEQRELQEESEESKCRK